MYNVEGVADDFRKVCPSCLHVRDRGTHHKVNGSDEDASTGCDFC